MFAVCAYRAKLGWDVQGFVDVTKSIVLRHKKHCLESQSKLLVSQKALLRFETALQLITGAAPSDLSLDLAIFTLI